MVIFLLRRLSHWVLLESAQPTTSGKRCSPAKLSAIDPTVTVM